MKKPVVFIALVSLLFFIIAACSLPGLQGTGSNTDVLSTVAVSTVQMQQTQNAYSTLAAQATGLALGTPISTLEPGTVADTTEPDLTATATPLPSLTPYPSLTPAPSLTPMQTSPTAPATLTPLPSTCNQAQFVADISAADGTQFWPNETFTKVWRLKNIGTCTWNSNYAVVFAGGDQLGGPSAANLGVTVDPGATVDIILSMKAPSGNGTYTGYWQLRTSNGTWFGLGTSGSSFTANIQVVSAPAVSSTIGLNFVKNFCAATWFSPSSNSLYCPGVPGFTSNIMYRSLAPHLQNNSVDNEAALITMPNTGSGGYIGGKFPVYKVLAGDHFTATIGCLYGYTKCNVRFRLDYVIGSGSVQTLSGASWDVLYNDAIRSVDVDLSSLVGQNVNFILKVFNNTSDSSQARAYWLAPKIKHGMPPGTQALTLKKTANPTSFSTVGASITYSYLITNSGNVNLAGPFNIVDDKLGNITCTASSALTPNGSVTCNITYSTTQADLDAGSIKNTAYVTFGSVKSNTEVVTVTAAKTSALTLKKTANPVTYNAVGDVIDYTYVVKNTGNVTLAGPFVVADNKVNPVNCPAGALAPGASVTCTGSYTIKQADLDARSVTNVASVSFGSIKSNTETIKVDAVVSAALTLKKTADVATYAAVGDKITYSFEITNSGNVSMAGPFVVTDSKLGTSSCSVAGGLAPSAKITCTKQHTVAQADLDAGSITNTASVAFGTVKSADETLTVNAVQSPALSLKISAVPASYSAVDNVINYSFVVKNAGNITLAGPFTVTDSKVASVTCPAGALAPGASVTCTGSYTVVQADVDAGSISNTATASTGSINSNPDTLMVNKA